jgi:DivIVA domain-containing protein
MEMSPQRVRTAEFKTVRKGADPDEVRTFLNDVADELERAQNQSTAMEARARAAVARLQEMSEGQPAAAAPAAPTITAPPEPVTVPAEQSDAISRTLVLAQRTADSLIAEAKAEAARVVGTANNEAATTRDSTREMASTMLDEARDEARRVGEAERLAIASEVDSLKARRDFLESDVDHLEQFLIAQRSRIRDAAAELIDVTDRVPGGLGDARRPLLSASDDPTPSSGAPHPAPADVAATVDIIELTPAADDLDGGDPTEAIDLVVITEIDETAEPEPAGSDEPNGRADQNDDGPIFSLDDRSGDDDPTPAGNGFGGVESARSATDDDDDGFRFTFDDTDDPDRPKG